MWSLERKKQNLTFRRKIGGLVVSANRTRVVAGDLLRSRATGLAKSSTGGCSRFAELLRS
ncbi:unnamed protein product [Haemonchus placei]|uniref:Transposase n=1 Tax=Haemonchus placei TaxID=6290 RepID=A0A0N4VUK2_HAEPC|nr:unnamed protein product [Haemonchus placei]